MNVTRPEQSKWFRRRCEDFSTVPICCGDQALATDDVAAAVRQARYNSNRAAAQSRIAGGLAAMLAQQECALRAVQEQRPSGLPTPADHLLLQQVHSLQSCVRAAQLALVRFRAQAYHAAHRARRAAARRPCPKTKTSTLAETTELLPTAA